ncbi:MAG: hypothetical protein M9962_13950 [Oligoflexia bacterium]|nr:hypothetical protein [Oligoflexia bacterium]
MPSSSQTEKVIGFTILRNGVTYDYPFRESLKSLTGLCANTFLALGNSSDATEEEVKKIEGIQIIPTIWDENLRKSGLILSQQTNIALEHAKKQYASGWAFYLQADEVLLEDEYEIISRDLQRANVEGCDSVSFRYLHFWQSYDQIAISRRWYPQEIRAVRLDSKIKSHGDAQGFSGAKKTYYSDAHIYHYGHVREANAYEKKKQDFHRWWHSDEEMKNMSKKDQKREKGEILLAYLGKHPKCMNNRIKTFKNEPRPKEILIYGDKNNFSKDFLAELDKSIQWTNNLSEAKKFSGLVVPETLPPLWIRLFNQKLQSKVPTKMQSPQAREWTKEFQLILKLSEKGVSYQNV